MPRRLTCNTISALVGGNTEGSVNCHVLRKMRFRSDNIIYHFIEIQRYLVQVIMLTRHTIALIIDRQCRFVCHRPPILAKAINSQNVTHTQCSGFTSTLRDVRFFLPRPRIPPCFACFLFPSDLE